MPTWNTAEASGETAAPPRPSRPSLAEIMDEQYAQTLSDQVLPEQQGQQQQVLDMLSMGIDIAAAVAALRRTNNDVGAAMTMCFDVDMSAAVAEDAAADAAAAAEAEGVSVQLGPSDADVSTAEQQTAQEADGAAAAAAYDEDRDLALALHLQQEEQRQAQALSRRGQGVVVTVGGGNVTVSHSKPNDAHFTTTQGVSERWGSEDADACNAAAAAAAAAEAKQKAAGTSGGSGSVLAGAGVSVVEGGGRRRSKGDLFRLPNGEVVSKHDAQLCGLANAHDLSGYMGVGDLAADGIKLGNQTANALRARLLRAAAGPKGVAAAGRIEKSVHATREGVLDPRTLLLLHAMVNAGGLQEVGGVVKAGKEACVFCGMAPPASEAATVGQGTTFSRSIAATAAAATATGIISTDQPRPVAIKVFKTTLNEFSNRHDYVDGDPRYTGLRFNKQSRSKMFRLWAEKEARNLARARRAGLPVPLPMIQRQHVLVMEFLGQDGFPAPQLREVELDSLRWWRAYVETLEFARLLLVRCQLVHGDLSEYNVLYVGGSCHFIDFGQSVHRAHHRAMDLLARDLNTMEAFVDKRRVARLGGPLAFAYATQYTGSAELGPDAIRALSECRAEEGDEAAVALLEELNAEAARTGQVEGSIKDDVDQQVEDDEAAADGEDDDIEVEDDEEDTAQQTTEKVELDERERARTRDARAFMRAEIAPTDVCI